MLRLVFIRHGKYSERTGFLSPQGLNQAQGITADLDRHGIKPDLILTSPVARAVETTISVAEHFFGNAHSFVRNNNLNEVCYKEFLDDIPNLGNAKTVFCISHQPVIADITEGLGWGKIYPEYEQAVVYGFDADDWKNALGRAYAPIIINPGDAPPAPGPASTLG